MDAERHGHYAVNADGETTTAGASNMQWTPQGQLASVTQTVNGQAQTQNRVYDAAGNLLIQNDPVNGSTAFLGGTELTVSTLASAATVVSGQRSYTAFGRPVAVRTANNGSTGSGSALTWLDADPHGTTQLAVNPSTGALTTRYLDPFGNARGASVTWASDRGFLNDPTDRLSGLVNVGARVYDGQVGRFLSVDPRLNGGDPQSLNGYAYADNNPVTYSDPSGLACQGGNDACNKNATNPNAPVTPSAPTNDGGQDTSPWDAVGSNDPGAINGPDYTVPSYVILAAQKLAQNPRFDPARYISNHQLSIALPEYVTNKMQKLARYAGGSEYAIAEYRVNHVIAVLATADPPPPHKHSSGCGFMGLSCAWHAATSVASSAWHALKTVATNRWIVRATLVLGGLALASTGMGLVADAAFLSDAAVTAIGVGGTVIDGVGCHEGDSLACAGAVLNGAAVVVGSPAVTQVLGGTGEFGSQIVGAKALSLAGAGFGLDFASWVRSDFGRG